MKVIQINSVCGYGSTGTIAVEIANFLHENGHECIIAYGQLTTDYSYSYKFGSVLENHIHNVFARLTGKQGYFSRKGTQQLIDFIKKEKPNIIHLHNLHGNYLNFKILFDFLSISKIPIVWTLHDCWAYTGNCPYYTQIGCYKWEKGCFSCPRIRIRPKRIYFDNSKQNYIDKKRIFNSVDNMTIVTVSKWLKHEACRSFLNNYTIKYNYNWIDFRKFRPNGDDIREKYGISKYKYTIVSVSAEWNKNTTRLQDGIKLASLLPENIQLVLVGSTARGTVIPKNIVHIPYISNTYEMAQIYSLADVYIHLSVEDTFGKVIAEAMTCGTPVIVYNSTACPEVVGSSDCGFIVEPHNVEAIVENILKIISIGKQVFSKKCIEYVRTNYDRNNNIEWYLKLYKEILSL